MSVFINDFYIFIYLIFMYFFIYSIIGLYIVLKMNILRLLFLFEILVLIFALFFFLIGIHYNDIYSQIVIFYLLTIAAVEASIGLALIYVIYRIWYTIRLSKLNKIKG